MQKPFIPPEHLPEPLEALLNELLNKAVQALSEGESLPAVVFLAGGRSLVKLLPVPLLGGSAEERAWSQQKIASLARKMQAQYAVFIAEAVARECEEGQDPLKAEPRDILLVTVEAGAELWVAQGGLIERSDGTGRVLESPLEFDSPVQTGGVLQRFLPWVEPSPSRSALH